MRLLKSCSLRGSSLAETVIAMVLISICLGIAFTIYSTVIGSTGNLTRYEAEQQIKLLIYQAGRDQDFEDEDFNFGSYTISKTTEPYELEGVIRCTYNLKSEKINLKRTVLLKHYEY